MLHIQVLNSEKDVFYLKKYSNIYYLIDSSD